MRERGMERRESTERKREKVMGREVKKEKQSDGERG